jgi:excisionase family DNA binding protein
MREMQSVHRFEYISTREAAALLGVALSTVQLWVETGALPAWKTAGGHRRIPRAAVDEMLSKQHSATPAAMQAGRIAKLLVVEDDSIQLELYRQKFAEWRLSLELLTAKDGFEGLILIGRYSPDLIITDLLMSGMDGFRMLRQLHKEAMDNRCDIFVVTALSSAEIEAAGEMLPGIPIYSKPIPFTALRFLIEKKIQRIHSENPL